VRRTSLGAAAPSTVSWQTMSNWTRTARARRDRQYDRAGPTEPSVRADQASARSDDRSQHAKKVKCAQMCEYLSVTRGSQRSRPPQQPGPLPQTGIMHAQVSHAAIDHSHTPRRAVAAGEPTARSRGGCCALAGRPRARRARRCGRSAPGATPRAGTLALSAPRRSQPHGWVLRIAGAGRHPESRVSQISRHARHAPHSLSSSPV
jgi:hypothetical protein